MRALCHGYAFFRFRTQEREAAYAPFSIYTGAMNDPKAPFLETLDADEQVRRFEEMFNQSPSHRFVLTNPAYQRLVNRDVVRLTVREARAGLHRIARCSNNDLPPFALALFALLRFLNAVREFAFDLIGSVANDQGEKAAAKAPGAAD
jgi:hypothetical protein